MRFVTAREANQAFSQILRDAEEGESLVITRRGRPVALLAPYQAPDSRERELAIEHIVALMREGLPIGGHRFTRGEMHERG
jgi:prevent-host-death family protein